MSSGTSVFDPSDCRNMRYSLPQWPKLALMPRAPLLPHLLVDSLSDL
eukprot:CAMPEP_0171282892 /NCGR_PEP_ID=MMETSP0790-20130122/67156_1 /TAXON_ID=2925 /ORGANISM="Alexandrium catenella, Strain OF101" /LENGTH=46 /DNA_ID= /DNA_START= /DNA_END= /DNA_ORIENTATION=